MDAARTSGCRMDSFECADPPALGSLNQCHTPGGYPGQNFGAAPRLNSNRFRPENTGPPRPPQKKREPNLSIRLPFPRIAKPRAMRVASRWPGLHVAACPHCLSRAPAPRKWLSVEKAPRVRPPPPPSSYFFSRAPARVSNRFRSERCAPRAPPPQGRSDHPLPPSDPGQTPQDIVEGVAVSFPQRPRPSSEAEKCKLISSPRAKGQGPSQAKRLEIGIQGALSVGSRDGLFDHAR